MKYIQAKDECICPAKKMCVTISQTGFSAEKVVKFSFVEW